MGPQTGIDSVDRPKEPMTSVPRGEESDLWTSRDTHGEAGRLEKARSARLKRVAEPRGSKASTPEADKAPEPKVREYEHL